MEVYKTINPAKLQELITKIRQEAAEWKIIDLTVDDPGAAGILYVARQVEDYFGIWDGSLFVINDRKLLVLCRTGSKTESTAVKAGLLQRLPDYNCQVGVGTVTKEGLQTIEVKLKDIGEKQTPAASSYEMLKKRQQRVEKIFFVVDDDLFMRSLLVKALSVHGKVVEFPDGKDLVGSYLKELPNVVFLDIHLPSGSGIGYLNEIVKYDNTAGIIILSADSVKENILLAQARGARGFLAKPFTKDKVEESMKKCLGQAELLYREGPNAR